MNTLNIEFTKNQVIVRRQIAGKHEAAVCFPMGTSKPRRMLTKVNEMLVKLWSISEENQEPIKWGGTD